MAQNFPIMSGPRIQVNCLLEDELNYELRVRDKFDKLADLSSKQRQLRFILNDENSSGLSLADPDKSGLSIQEEEFECKEKYKRIIRSLEEASKFKDPKLESRLLHLKFRLHIIVSQRLAFVVEPTTIQELEIKVNDALAVHFPSKKPVQNTLPVVTEPEPKDFHDTQEKKDEKQKGEDENFGILDLQIKLEKQNKTIESLIEENLNLRRQLQTTAAENVNSQQFRQLQQLKQLQELEIERLTNENRDHQKTINESRQTISQLQAVRSPERYQARNLGSFGSQTLPVNKWKPTFFGEDGKGLELNDFLRQIEFLAESECVNDEELHAKIHHLFEGRAKNWLMYARKKFNIWSLLKTELRRTFLSPEFDFKLRRQCEDRVQQQNETFSIYLAEMERMFASFSDPLTEKQKLEILKRNMKPVYRYSVASTDINSIRELDLYCGRLDAVGYIHREPALEGRTRTNFERPKPSVHEIQETATNSQPAETVQLSNQSDDRQQNMVGECPTQNEIDEIYQRGNALNAARSTGSSYLSNSNKQQNIHPGFSNPAGSQSYAHSGTNFTPPQPTIPGLYPWPTPEINNSLLPIQNPSMLVKNIQDWCSQMAAMTFYLQNPQTLVQQTQGQISPPQLSQNYSQQMANSRGNQRSPGSGIRRGCWNCQGSGHSFRQCPVPQNQLFCMRCGNPGVRSDQCQNCPQGNEPRKAA